GGGGAGPAPAATLKNCLFPDPDGPIKAVNDPAASATLTPSSATTAPSPRPYTLRTSRKATTGAEAAVLGERRVDLNMTFLLAGRVALHRAASRDVSPPTASRCVTNCRGSAALCAPRRHSLVVPCREPKVRSRDRHRREAGFGLVPSDDSCSYLGGGGLRSRAVRSRSEASPISHAQILV